MLHRRAHVFLKIAATELIDTLRRDSVDESMGLRVKFPERAQRNCKEGHLQVLRKSVVLLVLLIASTFQGLRIAREDIVDDRHIDEHLHGQRDDMEVRSQKRMEIRRLPNRAYPVHGEDSLDGADNLVMTRGVCLANVIRAVHQVVDGLDPNVRPPEEEATGAEGRDVARRNTMAEQKPSDGVGVGESGRGTEGVRSGDALHSNNEWPDEGG